MAYIRKTQDITYNGVTKTLVAWAKTLGLSSGGSLSTRITNWGIDRAFTEPVRTHKKHGLSKSPEYKIWGAMVNRCTVDAHPQWKDYGGRGITVCAEWLHDFDAFIKYIGRRPAKELTLGRLNVNGNYEPGNVIWTSRKQNCANRRSNNLIEFNGESKPLCKWAVQYNIHPTTLYKRISAGWTLEDALTRSVQKHSKK
jgi:hypothetical protein